MTTLYPVSDIYPAFQGEGRQTGKPMIVVRLQGCAVGCPWCDTKQTWELSAEHKRETIEEALGDGPEWTEQSGEDIARYVSDLELPTNWILLTGGEPARYDLKELVARLHWNNLKVALETSGTETGWLGAKCDWVTISPKFSMPGCKPVITNLFLSVDEIKMVIGKEKDVRKIEEIVVWLRDVRVCQCQKKAPKRKYPEIFLQPVSGSEKATEICQQAAMENGWSISIQVHKLIGGR